MFDQRIDHDHIPNPATDFSEDFRPHQDANSEPSLIRQADVPGTPKKPELQRFLRALAQKKERNLPVWLRETIGWGGFIGILTFFLIIQIYLNGIFNGLANQGVIGLSGVLEIGLLWLWELYWY